jgi:hypothetical protein
MKFSPDLTCDQAGVAIAFIQPSTTNGASSSYQTISESVFNPLFIKAVYQDVVLFLGIIQDLIQQGHHV